MKSAEWYKEKYPDPRGIEDVMMQSDGQLIIPLWLLMYIMKASGVKSKKGRIIKKTIKRGIDKLIHQKG
jgi:hypothetical protein